MRVETHRNGGWEPAFYEYSGNVFLIATDAETDSIRIQSSAYSATCRYRYRLEQDKVHFAGYLSLPGEAAYHNGICRVPLNTPGFLYVLSWNWNVPEMNNARMLQQQATLLAALRRQFPGLRTDICIQDELKQVFRDWDTARESFFRQVRDASHDCREAAKTGGASANGFVSAGLSAGVSAGASAGVSASSPKRGSPGPRPY